MNARRKALIERRDTLLAKARELNSEAGEAGMDDDQQAAYDAVMADVRKVNASIARETELEELERTAPAVEVDDNATIEGGTPQIENDPQVGFERYGDFVLAVRQACLPGGHVDQRLTILGAAPTTYGNEGSGADGGFLIPPGFSTEIFSLSLEGDSLLPLTDNDPISGNSMSYPKDETTPWGTNGIRAYWESEAAVATQTKPVLELDTLRLSKLLALVPVTDELLSDGPALSGYLTRKTAESIRWKSNEALFAGTGAGQPEGVLNAAATVSVAAEGGQAADTVNVTNVAKMFARLPAGSISRAVWMINNDVLPQLITMVLNNQPIYVAPGAIPNAPAGTLLGRPIMITQHAKTVGDVGDISLIDWGMYRTITKRGGIETATSIHLFFDAGATAFRATFRLDGQPAISAPIVPANGSNNLSPFVTLAERA